MKLKALLAMGLLNVLLLLACGTIKTGAEVVPTDASFLQGQLENGLRYYIRNNKTPSNRVALTLAVKSGSLQEEDNEQGLAHYLEHMAFNGSKNFPGNGLMEFSRDIGMQLGAHINAYTDFDRTVYKLELPTDDPAVLEKGLTALLDWAQGLSLDPAEVERERGVVLSEYRLNKSAQVRQWRKFMQNWFGDSRYGQRLPIGKAEVLEKATTEDLRRFYRKWYHPSLMTVIAVGAVEPQAFLQQIERTLAWKEERSAPQLINYPIERHEGELPRFFVDSDPEEQNSISFLLIRNDYRRSDASLDFLRYHLLNQLISTVLEQRIQDKKAAEDSPFLSASVLTPQSFFIDQEGFFGLLAVHKVGQFEAGYRWLLQEYQRWKTHPLTQAELERAKAMLSTQLQTYFEQLATQPSAWWSHSALNDFFAEGNLVDPAWLQKNYRQLLQQMELQQLQQLIASWLAGNDKLVQVGGNDQEKLPSPSELERIYLEEQDRKAEAPVQIRRIAALLPILPKPGLIVSEQKTEGFTGWLWQLSNGAQVYFVPSSEEKEAVKLYGWRPYGWISLEDRQLYYNARNFANLHAFSGLAAFSQAELNRYLEERVARVGRMIEPQHSSLNGEARVKDIETLMQLLYLQFQPTDYRQQDLDKAIQERLYGNQQLEKDPGYWGENELQKLIFGNDFRVDSFFSPQEQQALNLPVMQQIQNEFFAGASGFTFVIAGDVSAAQVKPLVERYLASLPSGNSDKRTLESIPYGFTPGEQERRRGNNNKAWLSLFWGWWDLPRLSEKEALAWDLLTKALDIRLNQEVREQLGGSYSPYAWGSYSPIPISTLSLTIRSDFDPPRQQQVLAVITQIVQSFKAGEIEDKLWKQVVEQQRRSLENAHQSLSFWSRSIFEQLQWQRPVGDLQATQLAMLKELTPSDLTRLARSYLDEKKLLTYFFIEEKK